MAKSLRKYTEEFKQEAVKLVLQKSKLHGWIDTFKDNPCAPSPDPEDKAMDIKVLLEENRRLHKENNMLKEEKEILKKAP